MPYFFLEVIREGKIVYGDGFFRKAKKTEESAYSLLRILS